MTSSSCTSDSEAAAALRALILAIRACRACAAHLPQPPRPIVRLHPEARILIVGQAPGARVQAAGAPYVDPSGDRLRAWMGLDEAAFYDPTQVAIAPAGFCFPGLTARGADKPPRPECARLWQDQVRSALPRMQLLVLAGGYGQRHHLRGRRKATLTQTVAAWRDYGPGVFPLPHPSWRNLGWLKQNPWFHAELVPALQAAVRSALASS